MGSRTSSSSRSTSPSSRTICSTIISTQSSTHSSDDSSVEDNAPAGRFDVGLTKTAPATDASANHAILAASAGPTNTPAPTDDAPAHHAHSAHTSRPPAPQPVRTLIRTLACVLVGGGLFSTIYGGLKLMPPVDPALEQQRGLHISLMVSGVVELVVGLVAGMQTLNVPQGATSLSHQA